MGICTNQKSFNDFKAWAETTKVDWKKDLHLKQIDNTIYYLLRIAISANYEGLL